jgi:hypothetical protein
MKKVVGQFYDKYVTEPSLYAFALLSYAQSHAAAI